MNVCLDKYFEAKIFTVWNKTLKSAKIFTLEKLRLYGKFNLHKCKVLFFGIQVNIKNIYSMSCTHEEHQLDGIEEDNDLGVLFNSSLKFANQSKNST